MSAHSCGYRKWLLRDASRDRPVLVGVWYPADGSAQERRYDYGSGTGMVAEGVPPVAAKFPVVVLSHGAFEAAHNYSWIAEHLARTRFLVLRVSHFGESFVYGPASIDPRSVTDVRQRTMDCSFVLDRLVDDSELRGIADPALGPGHTEESLGSLTAAAYIVGATDNDFLPYGSHAGRYARPIPGSTHTALSRGEGHFVFLNSCASDIEANWLPLCKDRDGVHREEIHESLKASIARFLERHLRQAPALTAVRSVAAPPRAAAGGKGASTPRDASS